MSLEAAGVNANKMAHFLLRVPKEASSERCNRNAIVLRWQCFTAQAERESTLMRAHRAQKSPGRRTGAKGLWGSLADSNDAHFASCILAAEFPPKHIRSAAEAGTAGGLCAAAL